jgi:predicted permease
VRLVVSPLLAVLMVRIFHVPEPLSTILILASGFPVAVNVFILATEYRKDREFASQSIFWTTILSAFTLSLLVYLFR